MDGPNGFIRTLINMDQELLGILLQLKVGPLPRKKKYIHIYMLIYKLTCFESNTGKEVNTEN